MATASRTSALATSQRAYSDRRSEIKLFMKATSNLGWRRVKQQQSKHRDAGVTAMVPKGQLCQQQLLPCSKGNFMLKWRWLQSLLPVLRRWTVSGIWITWHVADCENPSNIYAVIFCKGPLSCNGGSCTREMQCPFFLLKWWKQCRKQRQHLPQQIWKIKQQSIGGGDSKQQWGRINICNSAWIVIATATAK